VVNLSAVQQYCWTGRKGDYWTFISSLKDSRRDFEPAFSVVEEAEDGPVEIFSIELSSFISCNSAR
jgi:hypothetical protein